MVQWLGFQTYAAKSSGSIPGRGTMIPQAAQYSQIKGKKGRGLLKLSEEVKSLSRVQFFATPWTVAYYAPLSMGFSRQKYWSGLPFPSPEDLPDPGFEPRSLAL